MKLVLILLTSMIMAYPNRKRTPRQRQLKNIVQKGRYQRRFGSKALFYWYIKITCRSLLHLFLLNFYHRDWPFQDDCGLGWISSSIFAPARLICCTASFRVTKYRSEIPFTLLKFWTKFPNVLKLPGNHITFIDAEFWPLTFGINLKNFQARKNQTL